MKTNNSLRTDAESIITNLLLDINPYNRTFECANRMNLKKGKNILISIGKASWTMAKAISDSIGVDKGVVITKYGHSNGDIDNIKIFEAGHPIVDENGIIATEYVLNMIEDINEEDNLIMCISGGGSALFEKPLISLDELQDINSQLLNCGASISEINTIRKRLSMVKGGKFAKLCEKFTINAIILSDVIGDDLSSIASGPISKDASTCEQANAIIDKYNISLSDKAKELINRETVKEINNVSSYIIGSVSKLCVDTKRLCEALGYVTQIVMDDCVGNIEDAVIRFKKILDSSKPNHAYIIGGEITLQVKGNGLGGRNTELALRCAELIKNRDDVCVFTFGSDGTDGQTDAAGGYVDGNTFNEETLEYLNNNDSYNALKRTDGLIITGPTGSNINDIYVLLRKQL